MTRPTPLAPRSTGPGPDPGRTGRRRAARRGVGAVLLGASVALPLVLTAGAAEAAPSGLYGNPQSSARTWLQAHQDDSRAGTVRRVAGTPTARWFVDPDPGAVRSQVSGYVSGANRADQVPQVIAYAVPNRDCGGASAGGATSWPAYDAWVDAFAAGLGRQRVIVLLEPDSLAKVDCLDPGGLADRTRSLRRAVGVIRRANPAARVYLDAGHSNWQAPDQMANRLEAAGVRGAQGFFTNVANFQTTADEVSYGRRVRGALGDAGDLGQVIDTSRNGNGANGSQTCDPTGRRIGRTPTQRPGMGGVDALIWAKPPGESDGCRATAGQFVPDLAVELAGRAGPAPEAASGKGSAAGPAEARPTAEQAGRCTVTFRRTQRWPGGYRAEVAVTSPPGARGWTLTWRMPAGSTARDVWGSPATVTGQRVRVTQPSWYRWDDHSAPIVVGMVVDGGARPKNLSCRAR